MKDLLKISQEAVLAAGKMSLSYFQKEHTYHHKGEDANFATEADLASEKMIYQIVRKNFPGHNFLSEEMGLVDKNGEYTWVVDPIDGTVNFSHGQPLWGVECGIFKNSVPIIGLLYFPVLKEFYFAQQGKGAYLNNKKIIVSAINKTSKSLIALSVAYPAQRKLQKLPYEKIIRETDLVISQSMSTAYDLAALGGGRIDGFIEEITCIWDIAGGVVLLEEAGGKITDWRGRPLAWEIKKHKNYDLISANKVLYPKLFKEFNTLLK